MNEIVHEVDFTNSNPSSFVTQSTFTALSNARSLKSFSAKYMHLPLHASGASGDYCISPLLRHSALEELLLVGMSGVTDLFMEDAHLPRLRKVDLSYVHAVADNVMAALGSCLSLEYLGLLGCTNVDEKGMQRFLAAGPACLSVRTMCIAYLVSLHVLCLKVRRDYFVFLLFSLEICFFM